MKQEHKRLKKSTLTGKKENTFIQFDPFGLIRSYFSGSQIY